MQRAYLAGPMTGLPDHNFPAFNEAAKALREFYEVVNPAECFDGNTALPREVYMRHDLKALLGCDLVALLDGWQSSHGASLERTVARASGIPCYSLRLDVGCHVWSLTPLESGTVRYLPQPCPVPRGETVLQEAQRLVHGKRQADYGHPADNHGATAELWSTWIRRRHGVDFELTAEDVCWLNILQKTSREANRPTRDNAVDVCGYAANVEMIRELDPLPEQ